jgi:hypothetical protein
VDIAAASAGHTFDGALNLTALHLGLQRQNAGHAVEIPFRPEERVSRLCYPGCLGSHMLENL